MFTAARGDGELLARQAAESGASRVIACGGDGTVYEVVNGLMAVPGAAQSTAMGIAPTGGCNDLVNSLRLPRDPARIADALLHGTLRPIDLGRIGERYFATVATMGFDSEVAEYVDRGSPPFFLQGTAAYVYAILAKLVRHRSWWVRLVGDFGEFEGTILLVATGNSSQYGGRMKITPAALVDDGWLDVCIVRAVPRLEVLRMLPKVFSGRHVGHWAVSMELTQRLKIESREPLTLWADGERVAKTPTSIEVVPQAISVVAP